jgi:hypothetical protein
MHSLWLLTMIKSNIRATCSQLGIFFAVTCLVADIFKTAVFSAFFTWFWNPVTFAELNLRRQPPCSHALATVLKHFREVQKTKISNDDFWPIDGPPDHPHGMAYEENFGNLIRPHETFPNFLSVRKLSGDSAHVLDLFGSAVFLDEAFADSLTGVSSIQKFEAPPDSVRANIFGNLYEGDVWPAIQKRMTDLNISSFDLITIRPLAALSPIQQFRWKENFKPKSKGEFAPELYALSRIYFNIIQKSYELLSKNDGHLLFQFPSYGFYEEKSQGPWLNKLYANENKPKFTGEYGRIVKTPKSGTLPTP